MGFVGYGLARCLVIGSILLSLVIDKLRGIFTSFGPVLTGVELIGGVGNCGVVAELVSICIFRFLPIVALSTLSIELRLDVKPLVRPPSSELLLLLPCSVSPFACCAL